jgi:hypothetical protein
MAKKKFALTPGMNVSDAVTLAQEFSIRPQLGPRNYKVIEFMKLGDYMLNIPKELQAPRAELDTQAIAACILNENRYSENKFWLNIDDSEDADLFKLK